MDWPYIAGFFDGEGCLHALGSFRKGTQGFRVTISQTQEEVLKEIAAFLNANGIAAYVLRHRAKPRPDAKSPLKPAWNLWITERNSIRKFVEGVFPYLRVKRQRAEDYRRAVILTPNLVGATTPQTRLRRDVFFRLMESGKSVTEIATMYGLHYTTVYDKAKRFGFVVDSTAESNRKRAKIPLEKIVELFIETGSYQETARRLSMFPYNVRIRLLKNGIVPNDPYPTGGRRRGVQYAPITV
jgi:hypothetical protein